MSTKFKSYAQAGQDQFAYSVLKHQKTGFFVDIGCNHPTESNNSYGLERIGWTGIGIDLTDYSALWKQFRTTPFTQADATTIKLSLPPVVDYLSLDVDPATYDALVNLPMSSTRFRVITIEHDQYCRGESLRSRMRPFLQDLNYRLVCADVTHDGLPFEDWWVDEALIPPLSEKTFCSLQDGNSIKVYHAA